LPKKLWFAIGIDARAPEGLGMPRRSGQFMAVAVSSAIFGFIVWADHKTPNPLGSSLSASAAMAAPRMKSSDEAPTMPFVGVAGEGSMSKAYPLPSVPAVTPPTLPIECEERLVVAPPPTAEPPMIAPVVPVSVPQPHIALIPAPWRLNMEIGSPRTTLEIQRGGDEQMRIQCDAFDLSTPSGGLTARGEVVVSGAFLDARCERMTIAWPSGDVCLSGAVEVAFRHGGAMRALRAESVTFRFDSPGKPGD
jgi:hypothetical protein